MDTFKTVNFIILCIAVVCWFLNAAMKDSEQLSQQKKQRPEKT